VTASAHIFSRHGLTDGPAMSQNNAQDDALTPAYATPLADSSDAPSSSMTPVLTGNDGHPISWVGATDAPGEPGDPTQITLALAQYNYQSDSNGGFTFSDVLPSEFVPLLAAAAHVWEEYANIRFIGVQDVQPNAAGVPDIRVGVADLSSVQATGNTGGTVIGETEPKPGANDHLAPDTLVAIEDPSKTPVTALSNGDYQYQGGPADVFQDFVHELGHALGLGHNTGDINSVMYPVTSGKNILPDANDIAAIQSLYGRPTSAPALSSAEIATLNHLIPGFLATS
jgi:hypothetical protein